MASGSLPSVREAFVILDRVSRKVRPILLLHDDTNIYVRRKLGRALINRQTGDLLIYSTSWQEEREARKLHMPALGILTRSPV